ncbi:c-type cytochrome [Paludisphaera rhizosphaerae]|uniref:c-type cytochrome n=1 Tax=Paludisphaera rhizosphaerae TaxID=2711216 RepID=UPI0013EB3689|nr:c-type cytochrome [Paludisphaera rhizosphaerae]
MTTPRRHAPIGLAFSLLVLSTAAAPPEATVWTPGPLEVAVALPQPVDASTAAALAGRTIAYYEDGEGMPGPSAEPLGALKIAGVKVEDGGRLLVLATDPHPRQARYVLPLDGLAAKTVYGLNGVEASWFEGAEPGPEPSWKGWLPGLDPRASRRAADLRKVGRLRLDAMVKLPAAGKVEATIESPAPVVECFFGDGEPEGGPKSRMTFTIADASQPVFLSLTIRTGPDATPGPIKLSWTPNESAAPAKFLLPWATPAPTAAAPEPLEIPNLAGGDPSRGEAAFFSKEALCSQCHIAAGKGNNVGPDLTKIGRKGADYIFRSIALPNETVAPDFVSYTVSMKDGRVASGVVRAQGPDEIRIIDAEAKPTIIRRDEIEEFRPASTSLMPPGLVPVLGEARLRDIVAYLMKTAAE